MIYSISPARYAKNKVVVHIKNTTGYKSEANYMIEALGARWSHREGGYIASTRQVQNMALLLEAGFSVVSGLDSQVYKPVTRDAIDIKTAVKIVRALTK